MAAVLLQLAVWMLWPSTVEADGGDLHEHSTSAPCRIRFGVLVEKRDGISLQEAVSSVWNEIQKTSSTDKVEILLETTDRYQDMTMDSIIDAFIDMETDNVSAVIGRYIQPVLTAAQKHTIPYFLMGEHWLDQFVPYNLISVRPRTVDLYAVTVDIVRMYNWSTVAVVYERPYGSFLIESLVRSPSVQVRGWMVNRSMTSSQTRDLLLQVRNLDIVNVIVTCSSDTTTLLLNTALGLSMLSNRHTWILPTLSDIGSMVNDYSYSGVNLMTYQLLMTRNPPKEFPIAQFPIGEYATIYDSLVALYNGVRLYHEETGSCNWIGKSELIDKLSKMHLPGAMGNVSFREDGSRKGYIINILGLNLQGLYRIGTWNSSSDEGERLNITQAFSFSLPITAESHLNRPYKVLVVEDPPFAMLKVDHANRMGNDRYGGLAVDLLAAMAELNHFAYELHPVTDDDDDDDDAWQRVTQQLIERNASIGLAMAITAAGEEVIDFTVPFHVSGVSLLLTKLTTKSDGQQGGGGHGPSPAPHWLLYFCQPLSSVVWVLLLIALSAVTANVYIVERFSPSASGVGVPPPRPATTTTAPLVGPSSVEEDSGGGGGGGGAAEGVPPRRGMMLQDTVWLTVSTLLLCQASASSSQQRRCGPRTVAGRIAATGLHFFSLLLVVSYTANLTTLLTATRMTASSSSSSSSSRSLGAPQRTVRDLLDRREVRFVTARNSVVSDLLERSPDPQVHRVWKRILDDGGLVDRSELPLGDPGERCAVWDSAPVRYAVAQNCQLVELSVVADARRFALGVPQGAMYRDQLNMAVLTLLERGKIQTLQNKWLSSGDCDHFDESSVRMSADGYLPHRGLQLEEIGGVFLVFCAFLVVSVSVSVFEYCRHHHRIKGSCAPPDQPRTRSSVNCSSSSSNRASPRHDLTPSSLLQTDESISMNSSKSFDMSTYHHHHHHHHHRQQQQQHPYTQQHNRQTNIF